MLMRARRVARVGDGEAKPKLRKETLPQNAQVYPPAVKDWKARGLGKKKDWNG